MENHIVFNFNMASGLHKQIISPFQVTTCVFQALLHFEVSIALRHLT